MNKYEERSLSAYNKKAVNYDSSFEGRFTSSFKSLLLETVPIETGANVLDIACGNGRLLNMFAERYRFSGYGTDLSDQMIEQARLLNPSMQFSAGSCEHISLPDDMFDVITVCAAYHHFPFVDRFSNEAYRLLKKGGKIYIAEVYYSPFVRALCNPFVPLMKDGDVRFYSPNEIMNTLRKAGFQNQAFKTNEHIQIVSASKP
ncbi:MAG: methyltransferase domain-containing protein [Eubacteriales bacterium]|nr:methyltransferase domain-containing protein [Eubacteriales bacterium]